MATPKGSQRRASAILAKGLITDSTTYPEGGFQRLHDAFIGRAGEIVGRKGRRYQATAPCTSSATQYSAGCGVAEFHPDLGVAANFGLQASGATGIFSVTSTAISSYEFQVNAIDTIDSNIAFWNTSSASADWVNLGTSCPINVGAGTHNYGLCQQAARSDDEIFFAEDNGNILKWGGSNLASASAASASGIYWTTGTNVINGTSTTWSSQLEAGMYIMASGLESVASNAPAWRITQVVSDTQLQIDRILWSTVESTARLPWKAVPIALVGGGRTAAASSAWSVESGLPASKGALAIHDGRLFVAGCADGADANVYNFSRLRWSGNASENDAGRIGYNAGTVTSAHLTPNTSSASSIGAWARTDHWHPGGYVDVYPGIGGFIQGLVSLGDQLVILKSNGVFALRGNVNFGDKGDAKLSIVSRDIGAVGKRAFCVSRIGVVFAHYTGLYSYDGNTIKSLTAGRVQKWWDANLNGINYNGDIMVHHVDGRIYVEAPNAGGSSRDVLVYDTTLDYFYTQSAKQSRCIISVNDIDDNWCGMWAFHEYPYNAQPRHAITGAHYDYAHGLNFSLGDNDDQYTSLISAAYPRPDIVVPFNLGESPFSEGRVDQVYAHYALTVNATATPTVSGSLIPGGYGFSNNNLSGNNNWISSSAASEFTTGLNTYDRAYRLSVGGTVFSPMQRVRLQVTSSYNNFSLFALGLDYTIRNVVQSNYSSTD